MLKNLIRQFILIPLRSGRLLVSVTRIPGFLQTWNRYRRSSGERVGAEFFNLQLFDATVTTPFDPHYFYQSAWCAGKIAAKMPKLHVDIASQINLVAPLSGFVPVEFIDYRPLQVDLKNLTSREGSILHLPHDDRSVVSLSCLHVIEHIGLGRYGDPLDPAGSKKSCKELQRILAVGGDLYLTTPVGVERVEFNAHRVHAPSTIVSYFNELILSDFSYVDDSGRYVVNGAPDDCTKFRYGLGLFHFRRERP